MVTAFVLFIIWYHGISRALRYETLPLRRFTHAFLQYSGLFSALLGLADHYCQQSFRGESQRVPVIVPFVDGGGRSAAWRVRLLSAL